jgi:hypothetical protein
VRRGPTSETRDDFTLSLIGARHSELRSQAYECCSLAVGIVRSARGPCHDFTSST